MTSPEQEPPSKLPMDEYGRDERHEPLRQEVERWPKSNKNSNKEAPSMEQEPTTGGRRRRRRTRRMKKSRRTKKSRQTRKSKKRTHSRRHRRRH